MYLPKHFEQPDVGLLHRFIAEHSLGALVTRRGDGLAAEHIPFLIDPDGGPYGTLRAHVARANAVWKESSPDHDALVIFQGEAGYITPSWYPTKAETGKVVPTYNYLIAHAEGRMRAIEDEEWILRLVTRLTERFEGTRPSPWAVTDAPPDFIRMQLRALVGIEIPLSRLTGKWKLSQNRNAADKAGVVTGLQENGDAASTALAQTIEAASR